MWICKHCRLVFAFDSHIRANKMLTNHNIIISYELLSTNIVGSQSILRQLALILLSEVYLKIIKNRLLRYMISLVFWECRNACNKFSSLESSSWWDLFYIELGCRLTKITRLDIFMKGLDPYSYLRESLSYRYHQSHLILPL